MTERPGFDWLGEPGRPDRNTGKPEDSQTGRSGSSSGRAGGTISEIPGLGVRKRPGREKDPDALRNDPDRVMAGAYIRRDVRQRVKQALVDPEVGEGTNYSLLVDALLVRWLKEVGYPLKED